MIQHYDIITPEQDEIYTFVHTTSATSPMLSYFLRSLKFLGGGFHQYRFGTINITILVSNK